MRKGYILDTITTVDICETVKIEGKVIEVYESVIYREIFRVSPTRNVKDKLFALGQKYKDENNNIMHFLIEIIYE